MVGVSRVSSTCKRLAAALRAGDDATAASLAEKAQVPSVLLTEWGLGPRGAVDVDTAALALGGVAALEGGAPPSPECLRDPGAIAVIADAIELIAANDGKRGEDPVHPWAAGIEAIDPADFPGIPELFRARAAEGQGRSDEARALVELSLKGTPGLVPAMRDAMEYELCAGNWGRASELAAALAAGTGRKSAAEDDDRHGDEEIADRLAGALERVQEPSPGAERAGRNQPCPCGSGRKYKVCCRAADLKGGVFTLADRAPALYAMLATYAQRAGSRTLTDRFRACAIGAPHADMLAVDLAVFEGGIGERFLAARGHLLRPDERDLLKDWLTRPVDVYEVTRVSAGSELTVRSMTGGPDRVRMRDRLLSLTAYRLDLIVARLLPDGDQLPGGGPLLRVLGGIAKLDRGARRKPALEVFAEYPADRRAEGPDSTGFAARLLSQFVAGGTPVCQTSDGDEYRFCETSIEISGGRKDVWDALTRPCAPAPEPPVRSMAGYDAYIAEVPSRFWTRNDDGEIEYVGVSDADRLVNRGTVERTRKGFKITANSVRRAEDLVTIVLNAASEAGRTGKVTSQSAKTAQEMMGEHDADDKPEGRAAMCRRLGVDESLIAIPPREVVIEEHFLPLEHSAASQALVGQISRELTTRSMLDAREYDGRTPAEAVKAGGPALEKVLAMIDDCEWQLAGADPQTALALARPEELRRRVGLRGR